MSLNGAPKQDSGKGGSLLELSERPCCLNGAPKQDSGKGGARVPVSFAQRVESQWSPETEFGESLVFKVNGRPPEGKSQWSPETGFGKREPS